MATSIRAHDIIKGMEEARQRAAARADVARRELEAALRDVKDWDGRIARAKRRRNARHADRP
jgi:hypothetical protein